MEKPQSSLPVDVEFFLAEHYRRSDVILEYGSGASTIMAAEMPGKTVFSVESDKIWARNLRRYAGTAELLSPPHIHYVDIGRTGKWGRPIDDSGWKNWHKYPSSVWAREDFRHPDCILIDGRFRTACLCTAILMAERPITVLFDDYLDRSQYRKVEGFIQPAEFCGRMARFEVAPGQFPHAHLVEFLGFFTKSF